MKRFLISSLILFFGCGDDTAILTPDAPPTVDRPSTDTPAVDAPIDAMVDAMADATPDAVPLCPTPIRALTLPTDNYDGTLAGGGLNMSTSCQANTMGPENTFTLHVASRTGIMLNTSAARTTIDTVVEVRRDCDNPATAVFCDDDNGGRSFTSNLREIFEPGDYFVLVDQYGTTPRPGGPYNLAVTGFTPAQNAVCSMATALTTSGLTNQSSVDGGRVVTNCADSARGAQVYYTFSVPAGQRAAFTATPTGTAWVPTVRVLNNCNALACLATASGTSGTPATAKIDNSGTQALVVIVVVAGSSGTTGGTFDLSAVLTQLPYDQTTIAGSCDDVTTGTVIAGVNADDSASAATALPFTFTFFGGAMTFYSVTSNGFLQVWPDGTGTPSTAFSNVAIPSTANPNGYIAPFWDDLNLVTGETTEARGLVVGTTPNQHLTIQWTNWTTVGATSTRLTFQAKLFETTNVIELHYCTLTPGTNANRATGSSATVGIEKADGTDGIPHSFNTPMSVSTANAIRFTPR